MKEIRASAINCGDTVTFKKTRNVQPELVGTWTILACSKDKARRKVLVTIGASLFEIPWDRRIMLADPESKPVADNRSETRRVPAPVPPTKTPTNPDSLRANDSALTSIWKEAIVPPFAPARYPSAGNVAVGFPEDVKQNRTDSLPKPQFLRGRAPNPWAGLPPPPPVRTTDEPEVTKSYLDQQDRDRLLIEVLKLVASFVNSATGLIKKAAGLI